MTRMRLSGRERQRDNAMLHHHFGGSYHYLLCWGFSNGQFVYWIVYFYMYKYSESSSLVTLGRRSCSTCRQLSTKATPRGPRQDSRRGPRSNIRPAAIFMIIFQGASQQHQGAIPVAMKKKVHP
ncbi:MAG: hypothetical protein K2Z81_13845, partial [Cyanobacteria bacterium]|nr:hypothetical protein [Cyanobacteriota bacterium]